MKASKKGQMKVQDLVEVKEERMVSDLAPMMVQKMVPRKEQLMDKE